MVGGVDAIVLAAQAEHLCRLLEFDGVDSLVAVETKPAA